MRGCGQPLGAEGGLCQVARKVKDLRAMTARKSVLPTTWMIVKEDSSPEPFDKAVTSSNMPLIRKSTS